MNLKHEKRINIAILILTITFGIAIMVCQFLHPYYIHWWVILGWIVLVILSRLEIMTLHRKLDSYKKEDGTDTHKKS